MTPTKNYVNGEWIDSESEETFPVYNPADSTSVVGSFPASTVADVKQAIDSADSASESWATKPAPVRGKLLRMAAQELEADRQRLAKLLVAEEGKTLSEAAGEVNRAIDIFYYYAEKTRDFGGVRKPTGTANRTLEIKQVPLGTVGLITPWNYPIAIPAWKLAPALAAGNTVVLKPASEAPHMTAALVDALDRAGTPDGVINMITGSGTVIGGQLINSPIIDAISFTGSTAVGTEVAHQAAERLKRVQCEMGGKNPTVIMPSADIEKAVAIVSEGGFGTTGQSCTACSRVIVHEKIADDFIEQFVHHTESLEVGPGLDDLDMGPQVTENELQSTLDYVDRAADNGGTILTGGAAINLPHAPHGHFVAPTVISDVSPGDEIAQEEVFGPVLAVITVDSFEESVAVANGVKYGLSASIVTGDLSEAKLFADQAEAGVVKVNEKTTGLELHAPFGGFKDSSTNTYREQGDAGLDFFSTTKTIYANY